MLVMKGLAPVSQTNLPSKTLRFDIAKMQARHFRGFLQIASQWKFQRLVFKILENV